MQYFLYLKCQSIYLHSNEVSFFFGIEEFTTIYVADIHLASTHTINTNMCSSPIIFWLGGLVWSNIFVQYFHIFSQEIYMLIIMLPPIASLYRRKFKPSFAKDWREFLFSRELTKFRFYFWSTILVSKYDIPIQICWALCLKKTCIELWWPAL